MPYKIGVSSGWWRIDKPAELLGIAMKTAGFGATLGTTFVQVDLDTTSEFYEPGLKQNLDKVRKGMGMTIGIHGEVGELMSLESGQRRVWEQSHLRLVETVKNAAELGSVFVNIHMSVNMQLLYLESHYRIWYAAPVVSFDGKPLYTACDASPAAKQFVIPYLRRIAYYIHEEARDKPRYREMVKEIERNAEELKKAELERLARDERYIGADERTRRLMRDEVDRRVYEWSRMEEERRFSQNIYEFWKDCPDMKYYIEMSEIGAYETIATYMKATGDSLWSSLCGGKDVMDAYTDPETHPLFNAAVAMKYVEGHLTRKDHPANKRLLKGMSVLEWLEKNGMALLFEVPEAHEGHEGLLRVFNPLHFYHLISKLGSKKIKLCLDFEHMLAHKLEPDKILKQLPGDAGKYVMLIHLGKPVPFFGTAHIQIPVPSRAQETLYKWLYMLRKKGFRDGYLIYERGGGKTPLEIMQQSVWALRLIVENLEKDITPKDLPLEFFGISGKDMYARQIVFVRDHAWDPLAGLISVPEETHTFLGRAAIEKGKAEEWKKGRYR